MIRLRPYEWLHMTVPGTGTTGRSKLGGRLYISPHRLVIQNRRGPVWTADMKDVESVTQDTVAIRDGRRLKWNSKTYTWWPEAVKFWKDGVVVIRHTTHEPLPPYTTIHELPEALQRTKYDIRWYDAQTLGIQDETEEFKKTARDTNIILAALRHDGFPHGPPPVYYTRMLQRNALAYVTSLVWYWQSQQRRIINIITGKGHLGGEGVLSRPHRVNVEEGEDALKKYPPGPGNWMMDHPDGWFEPKPFAPQKAEWYDELNPGFLGGHPYWMLERCYEMIPIVRRIADILHEDPTHSPYLRIREVYRALKNKKKIPPPPINALEAARTATNNLW